MDRHCGYFPCKSFLCEGHLSGSHTHMGKAQNNQHIFFLEIFLSNEGCLNEIRVSERKYLGDNKPRKKFNFFLSPDRKLGK